MGNTSVINIEVKDEQFRKFVEMFKMYQDGVEEMPEAWEKLDKAMNGAGKGFAKTAKGTQAAMVLSAEHAEALTNALNKATKAQKGFGSATRQSESGMRKLASTAGKVGKEIFGVTKYLLKVGGIGTGLAGLGGLFGMDRLANNVMETRKSARAMGMNQGQLNAWRINMGQYVGSGVLSGAANAQVNPAKWGWLSTLGISAKQAHAESASKLAIQEINAVRKAWKKNPSLLTPQAMAAQQLGWSVGDIRNVGQAGKGLSTAEHHALSDAGALGYSGKVAREWSQLSVQFHRAGVTIETALIRALAPLTPKVKELSQEFAHFIMAFSKSEDATAAIHKLEHALGSFASFVGSKQFRQDALRFGRDITAMGHAMEAFLKFFGLLSSPKTTSPHSGHPMLHDVPQRMKDGLPGAPTQQSGAKERKYLQQFLRPFQPSSTPGPTGFAPKIDDKALKILTQMARQKPHTKVTIENKTGANISVSTNAASQ